jgi:hypothetical protein
MKLKKNPSLASRLLRDYQAINNWFLIMRNLEVIMKLKT